MYTLNAYIPTYMYGRIALILIKLHLGLKNIMVEMHSGKKQIVIELHLVSKKVFYQKNHAFEEVKPG